MKKLCLILLCLPLSISTFFAQKVSGVVTDATNKPQEFATVMLMRAKDSALVKGAITVMGEGIVGIEEMKRFLKKNSYLCKLDIQLLIYKK